MLRHAPKLAVGGLLLALAAGFFPLLLGEPPVSHRPGLWASTSSTIGALELFTPLAVRRGGVPARGRGPDGAAAPSRRRATRRRRRPATGRRDPRLRVRRRRAVRQRRVPAAAARPAPGGRRHRADLAVGRGDDDRGQPDAVAGHRSASSRATRSATRCPRRWRSRRWSSAWPRWRCCSRWCTASSWSTALPRSTSSPTGGRARGGARGRQRQADRRGNRHDAVTVALLAALGDRCRCSWRSTGAAASSAWLRWSCSPPRSRCSPCSPRRCCATAARRSSPAAGRPGSGSCSGPTRSASSFALVSVARAARGGRPRGGARRRRRARSRPCVLLLAAGLTGLFLTGDVFNFYVFFELAMTASYALTTYGGQAATAACGADLRRGEPARLVHLPAVGRRAPTASPARCRCTTWPSGCPTVDPNAAILVAVGFFVAFSVKLGLFPFHFWLPTVYTGSPSGGRRRSSAAPSPTSARTGCCASGRRCSPPSCGSRPLPSSSSARRRSSTARCWRWPAATSGRCWPTPPSARSGTCWSPSASAAPVGLTAAVALQRRQRAQQDVALPGRRDARRAGGGRVRGRGAQRRRGAARGGLRRQAGAVPRRDLVAAAPSLVVLLVVGSALSLVYMFQIYQRRFWRGGPVGARRGQLPCRCASLIGHGGALVLAARAVAGAAAGGQRPSARRRCSRVCRRMSDGLRGGPMDVVFRVVVLTAVYLLVLTSVAPGRRARRPRPVGAARRRRTAVRPLGPPPSTNRCRGRLAGCARR